MVRHTEEEVNESVRAPGAAPVLEVNITADLASVGVMHHGRKVIGNTVGAAITDRRLLALLAFWSAVSLLVRARELRAAGRRQS